MNIQRFLPLCKVSYRQIPIVNTTICRIKFDCARSNHYVTVRKSSSFGESTMRSEIFPKSNSFFSRFLDKFKLINILKARLNAVGCMLYESIADTINYAEFFEEYSLPDTFYSWFTITEIHIWMLSVRCMAEDEEGRFLRNRLLHTLWIDVGERVKHVGASNPAAIRGQINELSEQLQAALIAYDEGLQSSDVVLAGAIWRRMYQQGEVDPENLDSLVKYIRKHNV